MQMIAVVNVDENHVHLLGPSAAAAFRKDHDFPPRPSPRTYKIIVFAPDWY